MFTMVKKGYRTSFCLQKQYHTYVKPYNMCVNIYAYHIKMFEMSRTGVKLCCKKITVGFLKDLNLSNLPV